MGAKSLLNKDIRLKSFSNTTGAILKFVIKNEQNSKFYPLQNIYIQIFHVHVFDTKTKFSNTHRYGYI